MCNRGNKNETESDGFKCVIEGIRMRLRAMDLNVCNRGNKS